MKPRGFTEYAYFTLRLLIERAGCSVFDACSDGVTCWSAGKHACIVVIPKPLPHMLEVLAHEAGHQFRINKGKNAIMSLVYSPTHDEVEADRRGAALVATLLRIFRRDQREAHGQLAGARKR